MAIVVIHKDKVVTEHYSGQHSHKVNARKIQDDSLFCLGSVRKSYIGFAVAYAVQKGIISSIDDAVKLYLPDLEDSVADGLTIRHLLTHTHGLMGDREVTFLRKFQPGASWEYNNEGIRLLEELFLRLTNRTVEDFVEKYICVPLGLQHTMWPRENDERLVGVINDPDSVEEFPLGAPFSSALDLAYWGYLHLKKGLINEKQVFPLQIFEMTTEVQSPDLADNNLPQHGFLWYVKAKDSSRSEIGEKVPLQSFQIIGITGVIVLVIPQHDIVVVRMYNKLYNYGGLENYLFYLRQFGDKVMECLDSME